MIRRVGGEYITTIIEVICPANKAMRNGMRALSVEIVAALNSGIDFLLFDLLPPTMRNPLGIHAAVWHEMTGEGYAAPPDKPLMLVAYTAGSAQEAYVEPVAVGDVLPGMPVFLSPEYYVKVPLEATYQAAWLGVPRGDRKLLEKPT